MRFTSLVYLDPALISLAFEELKGVSPVTKIARSDGIEGGIGVGPFRLTGSSRETKEFSVSSAQMFFAIEPELRRYPKRAAPEVFKSKDLFWADGVLAIGAQVLKQKAKLLKEVYHFVLANEEIRTDLYLDLVTNDSYFTSGYDRMAAYKDTLGSHIWEPVETLLRPIYSNTLADIHLFAPFVILSPPFLSS
jgi:hypothetical protein